MIALFIFLMWVTPALIAGMLGWNGIWGSGNALLEFLIPVPIAGGVLHVPSFAISCAALFACNKVTQLQKNYIGLTAFTVFLIIVSLQIDFDRLYAWMTSDYQPANSPLRFESNPLYLFITTDALLVWLYSVAKGTQLSRRYLALIVFIPPLLFFTQVLAFKFARPDFKIGGSSYADQRGQETQYIYTNAKFDEETLLSWLDQHNALFQPWTSANTEHEALIFTNSRQLIEWQKFENLTNENTVATICRYEEDRSTEVHQSLYDCFVGKETISEKIRQIENTLKPEMGVWAANWMARAQLCDGVEIPESRENYFIALYNTCSNLRNNFDRDLKKIIDNFGENTKDIAIIRARAKELGIRPQ